MNMALETILHAVVICGSIALILFSVEVGYRTGVRRRARNPDSSFGVPPTVEAAIFGLMGLLITFIFWGAGTRFDNRRNLVVQEANAVTTAYLRLDLLPPASQPSIRETFRAYLQSRRATYQKTPDVEAVKAEQSRSVALQKEIWKQATAATMGIRGPAQPLVLSSINEMIGIAFARNVALTTHPPVPVFILMAITILASSGLAGYSMSASGRRDWMLMTIFTLILSVTVYVTLDYEFPRVGFIRISLEDRALEEALKTMD
jgi:hypothetical protein